MSTRRAAGCRHCSHSLMPAAFALQAVLDLATQQLQSAAVELQRLAARRQDAQSRLDQLCSFRDEYRNRLASALAQGLSADRLRDYQAFLLKLERAIDTQTAEVQGCQQAWQRAHQHWLALRGKEQAMLVLKQRYAAQALLQERRQEQKQQDEFALKGKRQSQADRTTH